VNGILCGTTGLCITFISLLRPETMLMPVKMTVAGGVLTLGLFGGCQKTAGVAPAPVPVKREMQVTINGQRYVWPCRGGNTNILGEYQDIVGGDPQGQMGIIVTFVEQPSSIVPKSYLARRGFITLNGVMYSISGISNNLGRTSWMQGELFTDKQANTFSGTFRGEDSDAKAVIEDGTFTTVIH
jgi:hypothetical protein